MVRSLFAVTIVFFGSLLLQGCDPILYARAVAPLVVPVDSACLQQALTRRLGAPSMPRHFEKRSRYWPATLTLYHGYASFHLTYPDTGAATLTAAEPVASGLQALFAPPRRTQDSVSRQLGRELVAARDTCGGRTPPGRAELEFQR
jgi:hypothetical protein